MVLLDAKVSEASRDAGDAVYTQAMGITNSNYITLASRAVRLTSPPDRPTMKTLTSLTVAIVASVVTAAPSTLDSRALAIEHAIANAPIAEDRSLANLFYPNKLTNGPAPQIASDVANAWTQVPHYQA